MSKYLGKTLKNNSGEAYTVLECKPPVFIIRFEGQVLTQETTYGSIRCGSIKNRHKLPYPLGHKIYTKGYGEALIIGYTPPNKTESRKCYVNFINTDSIVKVSIGELGTGKIKDPLLPKIHGVGFIGIGEHKSANKSVSTPAYSRWVKMLTRCYDPYSLNRRPTYRDCTVCKEWHNFQNFAEWFYSQPLCDTSDCSLDKDIKVKGNRVYSPDTCMLVTKGVNSSHTSNLSNYALIHKESGTEYVGTNVQSICDKLGLKSRSIYKVLSGQRKSHKGYSLLRPD